MTQKQIEKMCVDAWQHRDDDFSYEFTRGLYLHSARTYFEELCNFDRESFEHDTSDDLDTAISEDYHYVYCEDTGNLHWISSLDDMINHVAVTYFGFH